MFRDTRQAHAVSVSGLQRHVTLHESQKPFSEKENGLLILIMLIADGLNVKKDIQID